MPIHFKCPTCKRRLSVGSQQAGKEAACPNCSATIRIPTKEDAAAMKAMLGEAGSAPSPPASSADYTQFQFDDDVPSPPPPPPDSVPDLSALSGSSEISQTRTSPAPAPAQFDPQYVSLSRKVLYFQGVLLAAVAFGCFLLGYLSGLVTGGGQSNQPVAPEQAAITVSGRLFYQPKPGQSTPDEGAVLILFPQEATLDERLPVTGLRPQDPPAGGELQSVRVIQSVGGVYVRTGEAGDYKFALPKPGMYRVLRISNHAAQAPGDDPKFRDLDALDKYFNTAEDLLGNRKYTWSSIDIQQGTTLAYDFGVDGG